MLVEVQDLNRVVVNKIGFEYDSHSKKSFFFLFFALVKRQNSVLDSATQPAMSLEFGGERGMEVSNGNLVS